MTDTTPGASSVQQDLPPEALAIDLSYLDAPPPVDTRGPRRRQFAIAAMVGVLGVALIVLGTMVLREGLSTWRPFAVLGGLWCCYLAFRRVGLVLRGPRFDAALVLGVVWLVVFVLAVLLADVLPLAESRDPSLTLQTPSLLRPDLFSAHPFGTDRLGLDLLGAMVYGGRVSLIIAVLAVLIGGVIGGLSGLFAGFFRRRTDAGIGLFTDALLAFPPLILLLALVAALEPSISNIGLALAVLAIPGFIRLARANTLRYAGREFVTAARSLGATRRRIMFREILPNLLPALLSYSFLVMAILIVAEAGLSFLGLGVQRPNPTWGNLIAAAQDELETNPHLMSPVIPLFLTVFAVNRLGEHLSARWGA